MKGANQEMPEWDPRFECVFLGRCSSVQGDSSSFGRLQNARTTARRDSPTWSWITALLELDTDTGRSKHPLPNDDSASGHVSTSPPHRFLSNKSLQSQTSQATWNSTACDFHVNERHLLSATPAAAPATIESHHAMSTSTRTPTPTLKEMASNITPSPNPHPPLLKLSPPLSTGIDFSNHFLGNFCQPTPLPF